MAGTHTPSLDARWRGFRAASVDCRPRWFIGLVLVVLLAFAPTAGAQATRHGARLGAASHQRRGGLRWKFSATGYFTTVHEHGRWFFVSPTGQPFFSTGVDHVASESDTDQVTDQCPYCQTIASQYPNTAAWVTATVAQLRSWGFNSLGPFSDDSEFAGQMPYSVQLNMASGNDWFAPSFVTNADEVAATQVAPLADDPNLIGWYTDSELTWGPNDDSGNTELQDYLALPAGSPGLAVAQQYVGHPDEFLYALATRYFQVTTAAIRMYDTHHLILGVKAEGQYVTPQLLEAASRYINVFSIDDYDLQNGYAADIHKLWPQYLPVTPNFANFYHYAKIPMMVAEYSFIGETPQTPDTVPGVYATFPTQAARALAYTDYIAPLYEHAPWVVGDEWFEYVDEPQGGRVPDGENDDFGLVNVENQPYTDLVTQMEIMHSMAPDRLIQSGTMCDAWAEGASGVECTASMPLVTYPLQFYGPTQLYATQDQYLQAPVLAEGGRRPYSYALEQGSLPRGLRLHRTTGDVVGIPRANGTFTVTIGVTDSSAPDPQVATETISLIVAPRP